MACLRNSPFDRVLAVSFDGGSSTANTVITVGQAILPAAGFQPARRSQTPVIALTSSTRKTPDACGNRHKPKRLSTGGPTPLPSGIVNPFLSTLNQKLPQPGSIRRWSSDMFVPAWSDLLIKESERLVVSSKQFKRLLTAYC